MHHIGLTRKEIEHLQALIARLDAQSAGEYDDRRTHPRIDFAQPLWLHLPTDPTHPWIHIYARNLSTGGLGFLTRNQFHPDQHVVISHELNEQTPLLVLCRVCFCRTIDMGIQEVGMAFVKVLPDPGRARIIPDAWHAIILQKDWLARQNALTPAQ